MNAPAVQWPERGLRELLAGLTAAALPQIPIAGVEIDSRRVRPGYLFLACPGERHHGLEFVSQAVERGAVAIAWDAGEAPDVSVPAYQVDGLTGWTGEIAARFYGEPSRELFVTGITGTDGKTSCAHILAQASTLLGRRCGYLGTLGYGFLSRLTDAPHTTPDAVRLQDWFARLLADGADSVALEVSSHALAQGRINGAAIDVAVLTNIGRDHLDYHGDLEAYAAVKRRLFELPDLTAAVLNADDPIGGAWLRDLPAGLERVAYGVQVESVPQGVRYVLAREVLAQPHGLVLDIDSSWGALRIESRLLGRFNAYNLLAALAVLLVRGCGPDSTAAALGGVHTVPGRMELVDAPAGRPLVVVDYAHTPGALEQALRAVCEHAAGRVFCVFGCGGERDPGKRPLMAAAAARHADAIWVTDDNPRGEDPKAIVAEILAGFADNAPVTVEHDRAAAIAAAISAAGAGDAVLIAGKGHETYQVIGGERRAFDDRAAARRVLEAV